MIDGFCSHDIGGPRCLNSPIHGYTTVLYFPAPPKLDNCTGNLMQDPETQRERGYVGYQGTGRKSLAVRVPKDILVQIQNDMQSHDEQGGHIAEGPVGNRFVKNSYV
jgi:hypothetical protein